MEKKFNGASYVGTQWAVEVAHVRKPWAGTHTFKVGLDSYLGYYAASGDFGCGRNRSTVRAAIEALVAANGGEVVSVQQLGAAQ